MDKRAKIALYGASSAGVLVSSLAEHAVIPCAISQTKQEVPARLRKAIKRMAWIPVPEMADFQSSLEGHGLYCPSEEPFGVHEARTMAAVHEGDDTTPYQVGACLLYTSRCV